MTMLLVLAALLLINGVSAGNTHYGANSYLPLDMAPNSVDDMYWQCKPQMSCVAAQYLQRERNQNIKFRRVWDRSMALYNGKWNHQKPNLVREQVVAIYTYTSDEGKLYRDFNNAVRSQGLQYKTWFGFHALHFYLTSAIQALSRKCVHSYRRANLYFRQDVVNKNIRFGTFASSSRGSYSQAGVFGDKSCFEIYTCMGAEISMYSKYQNEREVLIPPYEVFRVIRVRRRSYYHPNLPCQVVYTLRSTKKAFSRLNCALLKK
ncbi:ecto-ADP-ribosyltransferase 5-like [Centropristis striata]|uniref:ecto-ADP-ribosyltransferase 5-like n=1 Tax=Centropristis striata TaxID=184440 RepID=UPI0027DF113C|nr:ecto-ADP-ribosyltransferase 5-like [Centropristis striata]